MVTRACIEALLVFAQSHTGRSSRRIESIGLRELEDSLRKAIEALDGSEFSSVRFWPSPAFQAI